MRLLLDTHIFLWYITGDERVGSAVRKAIENAEAVYVSVASMWEATIKYQLVSRTKFLACLEPLRRL